MLGKPPRVSASSMVENFPSSTLPLSLSAPRIGRDNWLDICQVVQHPGQRGDWSWNRSSSLPTSLPSIASTTAVISDMKKYSLLSLLVAPVLCSAGNLQPIHLDADEIADAYYEPVSNVYWSANANITGLRLYGPATTFIEGLDIGGLSGWRLPSIDELKAVYAALNGVQIGTLAGQMNPGPFSNVQFQYYWSSTPATGNARYRALDTRTGTFLNSFTPAGTPLYAWAVHSPVPEPAAAVLLLAGLAGVFVAHKRSFQANASK